MRATSPVDFRVIYGHLIHQLERLGFQPETGRSDTPLRIAAERISRHGDYAGWQRLVHDLPQLRASHWELGAPEIAVGGPRQLSPDQLRHLLGALKSLCPWRKGPFRVFGIGVDAEWRSDLKWARLAPAVSSLAGRRVLDVGCGNGYYCLRALGSGASQVVGIDPNLLFGTQFQAVVRWLPELPVQLLPLRLEELPKPSTGFDTVLSMGVLYHRRDPHEHLCQLSSFLRPGGELVLETLVLDSPSNENLVPSDRYANMRNVWNIPTPRRLCGWLERAGFRAPRVVNVTPTTIAEQRSTHWMTFHSLEQALMPQDFSRTIEGYPAPTRALLIAENP